MSQKYTPKVEEAIKRMSDDMSIVSINYLNNLFDINAEAIKRMEHFLTIPEGTVAESADIKVTLEGDALKAFQLGVLSSIDCLMGMIFVGEDDESDNSGGNGSESEKLGDMQSDFELPDIAN